MIDIGVLTALGIGTAHDIKTREIGVIETILFAFIGMIFNLVNKQVSVYSMVGGAGIGLLLYMFSILSKEKFGKGDALIIGAVGIWIGVVSLMELLWISSIASAFIGIIYLLVKKKSLEFEMPFVPFLFVGYICICLKNFLIGMFI